MTVLTIPVSDVLELELILMLMYAAPEASQSVPLISIVDQIVVFGSQVSHGSARI